MGMLDVCRFILHRSRFILDQKLMLCCDRFSVFCLHLFAVCQFLALFDGSLFVSNPSLTPLHHWKAKSCPSQPSVLMFRRSTAS